MNKLDKEKKIVFYFKIVVVLFCVTLVIDFLNLTKGKKEEEYNKLQNLADTLRMYKGKL